MVRGVVHVPSLIHTHYPYPVPIFNHMVSSHSLQLKLPLLLPSLFLLCSFSPSFSPPHPINTFPVSSVQNDKRYLVLECIAEEREDMLHTYMEDLHRKGPPPPPTATQPGDRLKRIGPP